MNPCGSFAVVGCEIWIFSSFDTSGIGQGSEPLARYPSVSTTTGVMYFTAIRNASIVAS
jgi:hypothetical protein